VYVKNLKCKVVHSHLVTIYLQNTNATFHKVVYRHY